MPSLMKGNVWNDRKYAKDRKGNSIVEYPVWVEIKHDEIRCDVQVFTQDTPNGVQYRVDYLSYAGKPLANMHKFDSIFIQACRITGWKEFDCGLEVNGNFNDSYRWVRSTKGIPKDLVEAKYRFILFDLPEAPALLKVRLAYMRAVISAVSEWVYPGLIDTSEGVECEDEDAVEAAFMLSRSRGYEGVMVKQFNHAYSKGKRTDAWLKMKPSDTADGKIVAINRAIAQDGTPHDRAGSVTVELEDGSVASPSGLEHNLAANMFYYPEQYIGQWIEFDYMERDRKGGYRHPVFKRFREAKA